MLCEHLERDLVIPIFASAEVQAKLAVAHRVTMEEVSECFANRCGDFLADTREVHKSDPPTLWFVAETDHGRKLKIVFMHFGDRIVIRSAYEPNGDELRIYDKHGK